MWLLTVQSKRKSLSLTIWISEVLNRTEYYLYINSSVHMIGKSSGRRSGKNRFVWDKPSVHTTDCYRSLHNAYWNLVLDWCCAKYMKTQPSNNILFVCGKDLLMWFEVDTSPRLVSAEQHVWHAPKLHQSQRSETEAEKQTNIWSPTAINGLRCSGVTGDRVYIIMVI